MTIQERPHSRGKPRLRCGVVRKTGRLEMVTVRPPGFIVTRPFGWVNPCQGTTWEVTEDGVLIHQERMETVVSLTPHNGSNIHQLDQATNYFAASIKRAGRYRSGNEQDAEFFSSRPQDQHQTSLVVSHLGEPQVGPLGGHRPVELTCAESDSHRIVTTRSDHEQWMAQCKPQPGISQSVIP